MLKEYGRELKNLEKEMEDAQKSLAQAEKEQAANQTEAGAKRVSALKERLQLQNEARNKIIRAVAIMATHGDAEDEIIAANEAILKLKTDQSKINDVLLDKGRAVVNNYDKQLEKLKQIFGLAGNLAETIEEDLNKVWLELPEGLREAFSKLTGALIPGRAIGTAQTSLSGREAIAKGQQEAQKEGLNIQKNMLSELQGLRKDVKGLEVGALA